LVSDHGNYHALDEYLELPRKKISYSLQSLIGQGSAEEDFRESVRLLNSLLGLNLSGTQSKRIVGDLAPIVDNYYEEQIDFKKTIETDGSCLAFGNDGKGVPIIKSEREVMDTGQEARLMKGKKRGVKKEATVSVSFSFNPRKRNSEDILRGLFREKGKQGIPEKDEKDRRISLNVHKRAFMCAQKKGINYGVENLLKRNPKKEKKIIALVDCGNGLEQGVLAMIKQHGLEENLDCIIADIVHVSEYIWKASNAIFGEKSKLRTSWVRSIMKDILESKTALVIKDLMDNVERTKLSEKKKEKIQITIRYLKNHGHKMDYKTYLEKGYPISTGLIEGCCGHLIKDRMEDSGMRWSIQGAQNIIDLRSVKKNGDWTDFMNYAKNINKPNLLKRCA